MSEPFKGAPHTVLHIKSCALRGQSSYELRLLAEDIVGRLDSKDYLSEILAIYYWVLSHTRYANDPRTVELVRNPEEMLRRLTRNVSQLRDLFARGTYGKWKPSLDCDDLTCLLCALFLVLGREVQICTVAFRHAFFRGQRQFQHVYLRVREPRTGNWIVLDPVAADTTASMLRRVKAVKIYPVA